jgi:hypothetical protein
LYAVAGPTENRRWVHRENVKKSSRLTYDTSGGLAALSHQSGAKYLSLAFLQTAQAGSCTAYWDGDTSQPISSASFGSDIATIQAAGGNVIPSFGGYSADTTGTDIADSCSFVRSSLPLSSARDLAHKPLPVGRVNPKTD